MRGSIDAFERDVAPLELGEEWLEPIRVLVVDRDRTIRRSRHPDSLAKKKAGLVERRGQSCESAGL
jgi:hypothetical protein